tara:strand:- start:3863 stop:4558 length:696 start_codon:yes stop_codon:yes gene_type:complete
MGWFSAPKKIDPNKIYGMMQSDYTKTMGERAEQMIDPNSPLMQAQFNAMQQQGQDTLYTQNRMNRMNMAATGMSGQSGIANQMAADAASKTAGNLGTAFQNMLSSNLGASNQLLGTAQSADMQARDAMASAYGQNITNQNNYNSAMAGNVMKLGGAALMMCDARMKNILGKVGKAKMKNGKTTNLYRFTYKNSKKGTERIGVVAQDLMKNNPKAVHKGKNGIMYIKPDEVF